MNFRALIAWPERLCIGIVVCLVRIYQHTLSPMLGQRCRYYPSCSRYMIESLEKYGLFRGFVRGLCRVARCHPWHPGGYDPP
jgi:putative membrane protein insertion efficiency factor